jgi:hypothetical protein
MGLLPDAQRPSRADDLDIDRCVGSGRWRRKAETEMTRYERRQFFERLVQLRALYQLRGDGDSMAAMPIDEAIAYGERLMADGLALAVVLGPDLSERLESTTPESHEP